MREIPTTNDALTLWYHTITRSLRELPYDLSQRQMGVLLTVYMTPPPHSIHSMATQLNISKPAICRAVDTLSRLDLLRRKKDEHDRRQTYLQRTINGSVFLRDFADIIVQVTTGNAPENASPPRENLPL